MFCVVISYMRSGVRVVYRVVASFSDFDQAIRYAAKYTISHPKDHAEVQPMLNHQIVA